MAGDHTGPRRSTKRCGWKRGPKSWKRSFLNEMKRTNNPLEAIKYAHITWSCYTEWLETGFLSQQELQEAEKIFKAKHPKVDIIIKTSDEQLEDEGIAVVAATGVEAIEATGYDQRTVLDEDGWDDLDTGYQDDW